MYITEIVNVVEQKQCIECKGYLETNNFYLSHTKNSYQSRCKYCFNVRRKINYKTRSLNYEVEQWSMNVLRHSRQRARIKKLEHNLTQQWVIGNISESCPVLLVKFEFNFNKNSNNYPSLDRFDNNKGYTTDNVRIISYRANTLKNNGTLEELEAIVRYMKND